ncbi:MAG: metallophosphoesterase [Deltaproteobacteria bacterium]|nr:metallophosphoesterase [Deltaproteobacteria bacterium]
MSLLISFVAVFAQVYLFLRIRQAIKATQRSNRCQFFLVGTVGLTIASLFVMNAFILSRPISWVDPPEVEDILLFYAPAVWTFGSIFSALVLALIRLLGRLGRVLARCGRGPDHEQAALPVNLQRRYFLQAGVGGLAAAPLFLSGYGAAYAGKAYEIEEIVLPFGRDLRVVQLTDIHAGLYMTRAEIRRYAAQVAALEPDLFVLTGDYISNSIEFLPDCVEEMAKVRARYGTFAIMGNHDRWFGKQHDILAMFRQHRITFLLNAHRVIHTEQGSLAVAGIDDLRAGYPDLAGALHGLDSTVPTILLSHRPEIFPLAVSHKIPLTLSGHYHGGQIKLGLPGLSISVAHLVSPYPEGLYRVKDSHLYVSRGIGTTFTPIRLNARPEVTLLRLT